jgi:hypothetical protein
MADKRKGLNDTEASTFEHAPSAGGPMRLKVTQIGNSLGVILPKELLAKLNVAKGDVLIDAQMVAARRIMKNRRAVLRELAK